MPGRIGRLAPCDSCTLTSRSPPTALESPLQPCSDPRLRPRACRAGLPRACRAGLPHTAPKNQWAYPIVFQCSDPPQAAHRPQARPPSLLRLTRRRQPTAHKPALQPGNQPQKRVPPGGNPVMRGPLRGAHLGPKTQLTFPTGFSLSERPPMPHGPRNGKSADQKLHPALRSGFCKATILILQGPFSGVPVHQISFRGHGREHSGQNFSLMVVVVHVRSPNRAWGAMW